MTVRLLGLFIPAIEAFSMPVVGLLSVKAMVWGVRRPSIAKTGRSPGDIVISVDRPGAGAVVINDDEIVRRHRRRRKPGL